MLLDDIITQIGVLKDNYCLKHGTEPNMVIIPREYYNKLSHFGETYIITKPAVIEQVMGMNIRVVKHGKKQYMRRYKDNPLWQNKEVE